jgi:hypothetical protein
LPQDHSSVHGGDNSENLLQFHHQFGSRSKLLGQILFFLAAALTIAPCKSAPATSRDTEFHSFYDQFLAAISASDKTKVADLIAFPVKDWSVERKGNVQTIGIVNKTEFLTKYGLFFTPSMRSHALKGKPQKISDDHYALIWQDADAEFSLEFEYASPKGFRLTSYLIGPR